MKSVSDMLYTDMTYMNQSMKMARATPNAAIIMMTKITPATVPAVPLRASAGGITGTWYRMQYQRRFKIKQILTNY